MVVVLEAAPVEVSHLARVHGTVDAEHLARVRLRAAFPPCARPLPRLPKVLRRRGLPESKGGGGRAVGRRAARHRQRVRVNEARERHGAVRVLQRDLGGAPARLPHRHDSGERAHSRRPAARAGEGRVDPGRSWRGGEGEGPPPGRGRRRRAFRTSRHGAALSATSPSRSGATRGTRTKRTVALLRCRRERRRCTSTTGRSAPPPSRLFWRLRLPTGRRPGR